MFMRNHTGVNLYHKAFVGLVEFVREVRWNYRWTDNMVVAICFCR